MLKAPRSLKAFAKNAPPRLKKTNRNICFTKLSSRLQGCSPQWRTPASLLTETRLRATERSLSFVLMKSAKRFFRLSALSLTSILRSSLARLFLKRWVFRQRKRPRAAIQQAPRYLKHFPTTTPLLRTFFHTECLQSSNPPTATVCSRELARTEESVQRSTRPKQEPAEFPPLSRICRTFPCAIRRAERYAAFSPQTPAECLLTQTIRRLSCASLPKFRATRKCFQPSETATISTP